jgi:hypothetical protein
VGTPLEVTYVRKDGNTKIYSIKLIAWFVFDGLKGCEQSHPFF